MKAGTAAHGSKKKWRRKGNKIKKYNMEGNRQSELEVELRRFKINAR